MSYSESWWTAITFIGLAIGCLLMNSTQQHRNLVETATYSGALAIALLITGVVDSFTYNPHYENAGILLLEYLTWIVISGSILGMSIWREFGQKEIKAKIRLYIAYGLFTLASLIRAISCNDESNRILFAVILMITQSIILILGTMKHKLWAVISSISTLVLALMIVAGDAPYLWIGLIGISLIAFVIWQIRRSARKITTTTDNNAPKVADSVSTPSVVETPKTKTPVVVEVVEEKPVAQTKSITRANRTAPLNATAIHSNNHKPVEFKPTKLNNERFLCINVLNI